MWVALLVIAAPLSFQDVLERVRNNSEALKAARAEAEVADAEVERAWVGWQPKLDAIGSATFNSDEQKFLDRVIQPKVELNGAAKLSQTLFNISVLRAPGAAKAARAAANARADATEDALLFEAATLYAMLGGLQAQEAAAARALAVAEKRKQDAQAAIDAGTATKLHLTRAETDRVVALGQKARLSAQRQGVNANLAAMLALDTPVELAAERISVPPVSADAERKVIVARSKEVEAAEKQIGLSELNWMPSLAVEGLARYTNEPGFSDDNFSARATVNLVFPIYDGGLRYAETHAAEARAKAARHRLEQERLEVRAYLEDATAQAIALAAELEQAQAQLQLANETVTQTEDLLKVGLATNLELTDADSRRFAADRAVAEKQLQLDLAMLRVFYARGGSLVGTDR